MFSVANLVPLWKDAPEVGLLYSLDRKCCSLVHWACSVGTSCVLSMLSSVYVWSHDLATHGLVQYCGEIIKIVYPLIPFIIVERMNFITEKGITLTNCSL